MKKLVDKFKKSKKQPEDIFTDDELLELYLNDFELPEPKYKEIPYSLIIVDDCAANPDLLKSKGIFTHFMLKARHHYTSCVLGLQLWKNGLSRGLRGNLEWLVLAANKSRKVQEDVFEDFSSYAGKEEFIAKWDKATQEPYSWFCVNLSAPKELRFTKNFDQPI
jgi:hypothetical protein